MLLVPKVTSSHSTLVGSSPVTTFARTRWQRLLVLSSSPNRSSLSPPKHAAGPAYLYKVRQIVHAT